MYDEKSQQNSEMSDRLDKIGSDSDSVMELVKNLPVSSPQRVHTTDVAVPWQDQSPSLEFFGAPSGFDAYLPSTSTTVMSLPHDYQFVVSVSRSILCGFIADWIRVRRITADILWPKLPCSDPALKQAMATLPPVVPPVTTRKNATETEKLMTCPCRSSASELEVYSPSLLAPTQPTLLAEERGTQSLQCLTESTSHDDLAQGCFLEEERSVEIINPSMDGKLESMLQFIQIPQPTRSSLHLEAFSNGVEIMQLDSSKPESLEEFDATNTSGKVVSADKSCTAIYHPKKKLKRKYRIDLGDDLPIEFIDFHNGEKLCSIQNGLEIVQQDTSNQQPMDSINSGRNVSCGEQSDIAITHSQENGVLKVLGRPKRKNGIQISLEYLQQHAEMPLKDAAKCLNVSRSTLKRICRDYGINRWPPCKIKKDNHSLSIKSVRSVDREQILESNSNLPSKQASEIVAHTKPRDRMTQYVNIVTIKAKYANDITIKFELSLPWRLIELQQQVAKRLNLAGDAYYIKYKDADNDLILIACDDDLETCICTCRSFSTSIQVFLQPK